MILWKTKNFLSLVQTTVHLSNAEAKHRYTGKKWFRFLWKQRGQIELGFSWHNKRYWWSYTNFFSESSFFFFFYIGGGPYLSGCCVWWTCFRKNIIWWNNYDWAKRLRRNLDSCIHFFFLLYPLHVYLWNSWIWVTHEVSWKGWRCFAVLKENLISSGTESPLRGLKLHWMALTSYSPLLYGLDWVFLLPVFFK